MGRRYNDLQPARIILRELQSVQYDFVELNFPVEFVFDRFTAIEEEPADPPPISAGPLEGIPRDYKHKCKLCLENLINNAHQRSLVTVLCCHSFHLECFRRYSEREAGCPICRYSVWPQPLFHCDQCNEYEEVWMCKTCYCRFCGLVNPNSKGKVSHAYQHIRQTGHRSFVSL